MESLEEWLTQPEGLSTRLKALRVRAGMTGKQFASAAGWDQAKVSRIERGRQKAPPSADDIKTWARITGASPQELTALLEARVLAADWNVTFQARMRSGQAAVQKTYTDLARSSTLIRHYENVFIPGPLQVPGYMRRIFTEMISLQDLQVDDVDAAVAERQQRAQLLYEPGRQWEFLLTEPVLRFLLPPPNVMRTQLDRLQTVIGLENVRFGVIPMGRQLATSPQDNVQIYVGEETVAAVESFIGEHWYRAEKAARYGRAVDRLWKDAVEGDQARELIVRAAQALPD
jgi:transcriptional regulator with XRE-family HTH domain